MTSDDAAVGAAGADVEAVADDAATCSIQASLDVLGDRWTILILRDAFRGVRRFEDFRRDLDIARPVLTDRLKRLVERGVLAKHLYCERPPRHEYRLTAMGMALSPALVALMRWGDRWLAGGAGPTVLVHDACGEPLDQRFVCWSCDETVTPYDIASRPGPGSPDARPSDPHEPAPAPPPAAASATSGPAAAGAAGASSAAATPTPPSTHPSSPTPPPTSAPERT